VWPGRQRVVARWFSLLRGAPRAPGGGGLHEGPPVRLSRQRDGARTEDDEPAIDGPGDERSQSRPEGDPDGCCGYDVDGPGAARQEPTTVRFGESSAGRCERARQGTGGRGRLRV